MATKPTTRLEILKHFKPVGTQKCTEIRLKIQILELSFILNCCPICEKCYIILIFSCIL